MSDIRDIRNRFVEDATKVLLHRLSIATTGEGTLDVGRIDTKPHNEIIRDLMEMLKRLDDREKIAVESTAKVIEGLAEGKLSISDAERLMRILHNKMEIEEVPKLTALLENSELK